MPRAGALCVIVSTMHRGRVLLALILIAASGTSVAWAANRVGTRGDDTIQGTSGADRITGRGGNDRLSGRGCNDTVNGGTGDDLVAGDAGNDVLIGGPGADTLLGGAGRDRLNVAARNRATDTAAGGAGNDRVLARDGSPDQISCGPGRDFVQADAGDSVAGDCERILRG